MRRLVNLAAASVVSIAIALTGLPSLVSATSTTEPPPESVDEQGGITGVPSVTAPLNPSAVTTIPSGCASANDPQVVFIGQLIKIDDTTATYSQLQVRAGSLGGYSTIDASVGDVVNVRYGRDTKFLSQGHTYLVGAASAINSPILVSKVRAAAELFGGDQVIGQSDQGTACPRFDDPIRTFNEDGTSIDTGVFSPLLDNQWQILLAILVAVGLVIASLAGVVIVKQLFR
ncbi:MAG: hypothetical protein ABIQ38_08625 [Ilumatobacteraceae bacterium]